MVRNIVGALVYVGNGRLSVQGFAELLAEKKPSESPADLYAGRAVSDGCGLSARVRPARAAAARLVVAV